MKVETCTIYAKSGEAILVDKETAIALSDLSPPFMENGKPCVYLPHRRKSVLLHRLVMGAGKGEYVDHRHHNFLDCRRSELRLCTNQQNCFNQRKRVTNTSGYKGVCPKGSRWTVQLVVSGKRISGGTYPSREVAARVYDKLAVLNHGDFACLNFPADKATAASYVPPKGPTKYRRADATSKYRGVVRNVRGGYVAQMRLNKVLHYLGYYKTAIEAARIYDAFARKVLGDKARLNFP